MRKPYHERRREEESRRNRQADGGNEREPRMVPAGEGNGQHEHSEARTSRVIKFKQPQLSADMEQPIIRGRRNSWRRNDLPEDNKGNDNE